MQLQLDQSKAEMDKLTVEVQQVRGNPQVCPTEIFWNGDTQYAVRSLHVAAGTQSCDLCN